MLCPTVVLERVLAMSAAGWSDSRISEVLNDEGIATPAGGRRWQRCHVWRLRHTAAAIRRSAAEEAREAM
ncbi:Recombinase [Nocardia amikacinitolerans]|nr:Recombinase [Nocardia amikacinitolerans]